MLFESNEKQLNLFHSEADEALDIVVELLSQLGHTGVMERVYTYQQNVRWLDKLESHPSYKAAKERKRQRFFKTLDDAAKIAEKMPDWMKGVR